MKRREKVLQAIQTAYAYQFAKQLEQFRCHPRLGYRSAGSQAEWQTGEWIAAEMKAIGLQQVHKDQVMVDSWTFRKAHLSFINEAGSLIQCELGGYQTQFDTHGPQTYQLIYMNKGIAADYKNKEVTGKLVLIDINQRDEWWINYPVYQAYLKGAAAVLAVQTGGYGEVHPEALNAQDIAGPSQAAAFSISRKDAEALKSCCKSQGEVQVTLDAQSVVTPNVPTYNIVGTIPGRDQGHMLLFSGHYDSYFTGFQDDNAAIGMLLGIAKAVIDSGYQPQKTWVFCAMAAEEWGVIDSKYDWSTGAYEEVFHVHPEWQGKVIADFNFELPAFAHGKRDYIRCIYEYQSFLRASLKKLQPPEHIYPKGIGVISPILTWSDDFSMAISGIPSMVNDFSTGRFMETHYHSQFDNESVYHEDVYQYHHQLYAQLGLDFDETLIAPLQFRTLLTAIKKSLDKIEVEEKKKQPLLQLIQEASKSAGKVYQRIQKLNQLGSQLLSSGADEQYVQLQKELLPVNGELLALFKTAQDKWVRLNWHDEVAFPHVLINENLQRIDSAKAAIKENDINGALSALYHIDNNRYAFLFEKEVYDHFTQYVLCQPKERLKWGYHRVMPQENLFMLVQKLKTMKSSQPSEMQKILKQMDSIKRHQKKLMQLVMHDGIRSMSDMKEGLCHVEQQLTAISLKEK